MDSVKIINGKDREPNDVCSDLNSNCWDAKSHVSCWLRKPENGICPFLVEEEPVD